MDSNRKIARIVGVLFLTGMITYLVGMVFYRPTIDDLNFLINVSANSTQVVIGILLQLIMGQMLPIFKL